MQEFSLLSDILRSHFVIQIKSTLPKYAYSVKNYLIEMLCSLLQLYFTFSLKNVAEGKSDRWKLMSRILELQEKEEHSFTTVKYCHFLQILQKIERRKEQFVRETFTDASRKWWSIPVSNTILIPHSGSQMTNHTAYCVRSHSQPSIFLQPAWWQKNTGGRKVECKLQVHINRCFWRHGCCRLYQLLPKNCPDFVVCGLLLMCVSLEGLKKGFYRR